jgi:hypothetical protein
VFLSVVLRAKQLESDLGAHPEHVSKLELKYPSASILREFLSGPPSTTSKPTTRAVSSTALFASGSPPATRGVSGLVAKPTGIHMLGEDGIERLHDVRVGQLLVKLLRAACREAHGHCMFGPSALVEMPNLFLNLSTLWPLSDRVRQFPHACNRLAKLSQPQDGACHRSTE